MIIALDAAYDDAAGHARVAGVLFATFDAATASRIVTATVSPLVPYEPGAFYKRELPCLLAALAEVSEPLETIVIDGYVWLDAEGRPGLGAHLRASLGGSVPVIGVAKTPFRGDSWSQPVLRGESRRPLHVTAAGMALTDAAATIARMHGANRIPTLLHLADAAARGRT